MVDAVHGVAGHAVLALIAKKKNAARKAQGAPAVTGHLR